MAFETRSAPWDVPYPRAPANAPGGIIGASAGAVLRLVRDDDAKAIIALITSIWSEYPGKILVAATDMPELLQPATSYARCNGRFWVIEANGRIGGTVALQPSEEPGVVELQKLYVARELRHRGLGSLLCYLVEREARERGAHAVELWSDVKLHDAHRRYERQGYRRAPQIRVRDDTSKTVQYYYRKPLADDDQPGLVNGCHLPDYCGDWRSLMTAQSDNDGVSETPAA
jgi:putative acetyltransferase